LNQQVNWATDNLSNCSVVIVSAAAFARPLVRTTLLFPTTIQNLHRCAPGKKDRTKGLGARLPSRWVCLDACVMDSASLLSKPQYVSKYYNNDNMRVNCFMLTWCERALEIQSGIPTFSSVEVPGRHCGPMVFNLKGE
jgi:hypothetical protein